MEDGAKNSEIPEQDSKEMEVVGAAASVRFGPSPTGDELTKILFGDNQEKNKNKRNAICFIILPERCSNYKLV